MYISELRIDNFRCFGEGNFQLILPLRSGLTALVGENDTGKTAVIDALRFALGTTDQEYFRIQESDFHFSPSSSERAREIRIRCCFRELTWHEKGAFVEHLTYENRNENSDMFSISNHAKNISERVL